MKVATRRLLEEQIAVVIVLESGKKDDAMWHVPQFIALHRHDYRKVEKDCCGAPVHCTVSPRLLQSRI